MARQSQIQIFFVSLAESAISFYFLPRVFPTTTLAGTFLIFLLINWSFYFVYLLIIYPFFLSPFRHLPKPGGSYGPIIAHGPIMFSQPPGSAFLRMMKEVPNDGIIHYRSFFHEDRLLLTEPAQIGDVLVHKSYDFEKSPWIRTFLRQFLGDGLLMTEGDEHKHQRKQIMPAFSFRHIKELYPVFWSKSVELCGAIKAELLEKKDGVIELNHFSTQVTMDIIGLAGLGRDIGSLRNADDELIKNYEEILEPTAEKGIYFVLHLMFPLRLIKMLPWKLNERVKITTKSLKRICREFVQEKKARMKMQSEEQIDILSILLRSNAFSDDGLVDQLLTFLAAGHETTSSAFTWASHLLALNPDVQKRLRAEIHENIALPRDISSEKIDIAGLLESLPYLNAVCNETLRLYPTIPVSSRVATRDTSICGQYVPAGTLSFIVPWAINRNPRLWGEDAEKFRPERWIDPGTGRANYIGSADSNYSFLTFLHGPRSCIGEKFARAELRALVAVFCGSFEMQMADPNKMVKPGGTITSKPIGGMWLRLHPVAW
ncbi:cytochrome P450 [Lindgomyces ingoldianus]|uniref:Cytochrome P450 n=1 Tax=Lindgomyces ingoldianus TaxID=673940 RepID=A0ACB6Q7J8_9PLEO|nr:cytochrome P450 [Lindgomyces ingoldianus]KAF2462959.1 cytochrome P450 [Lindgomyces ingoldianus]